MPRVNVDFWDVFDEHGNPLDLLPVIEHALNVPIGQRIKDHGAEHADILVEGSVAGRQALGLATRARKQNLPGRVDLRTGQLDALPLKLHEAVGEQMNFLYDQPLGVLVTQRNPVLRIGALENLLFEITRTDFSLQPKLRPSAWERLNRMTTIGSFDVKIRGPQHHPDFSQSIPSLGQMLDDVGERAGAMNVELILSAGRGRDRRLNLNLIRRVLSRFRADRGNVSKLAVRGRYEEDGKSDVIDFIKDRLVFTGTIEYEGRQIDRTQCRQLLRTAIEQNRHYLQGLL